MCKKLVITMCLNFFSVTEGVYLYNSRIDPYVGDVFHETPIGLYFFNFIQQHLPRWGLLCLFVFIDLLTALLLGLTAKEYATERVSSNLYNKMK